MYQPHDAPNTVDGDAQLLSHAIPIIETSGIKGLSLRPLAQAAGISPSLLTYRYGSRDGLLSNMFQLARNADSTSWKQREAAVSGSEFTPQDLPSLALATVFDTVTRTRQATLMQWICLTAAERIEALKPVATGWPDLAAAFWSRRLTQTGLDPELAAPFAAGLSGAAHIGLLAHGNPRLLAWMNDVILRLCQRISTVAVTAPGDSPGRIAAERIWLEQTSRKPPARTDTPKQIIDCAAGLIISHGPDAITHRLIADHSGISLSSMTHHFTSLDDIMLRAFEHIYDHARHKSSANLPDSMSIETLSRNVLPEILMRARERGPEGTAMDEIILFAARKPATAPLAGALLAMVGQTSTTLLQTVEPNATASDRLDGQIFRFVLTGLSEQSSGLPADRRNAWMSDMCEHYLKTVCSSI